MNQDEIRERVGHFSNWHYEFDLQGIKTPIHNPTRINRHEQRKLYFFDPLVELFGGTLAGKRVLDLGCNAGFWSHSAIEAGCDFVMGIDAREQHIDQSNLVFEALEIEKGRYDFRCGNLFEIDFAALGMFDIVLCLGLLYHVSKPMELFERINAINDDILLVDTSITQCDDARFTVIRESTDDPRNAADYDLAFRPSEAAVIEIVGMFGYDILVPPADFSDYAGAGDYANGNRKAFICSKSSDLGRWQRRI